MTEQEVFLDRYCRAVRGVLQRIPAYDPAPEDKMLVRAVGIEIASL